LTTSTEDRGTSLPYPETAPSRHPLGAALKRALFGISPGETSFARRGFHGGTGAEDAAVRERLERVGTCFVAGYHAALEVTDVEAVAARIEAEVDPGFHGFAYEGAGMALALLDALSFPGTSRDRLARFLAGPGNAHAYIVIVGAGWILARLPLSPERLLGRLDPLQGWLALDGYGFHEGFFHWPRSVTRREVPRKLRGYARRGFDQGLGRSLWFVEGADVERIPRTIGSFPADRQADLWAGLGLAVAYAGGRSQAEVEALRRAAGAFVPELAQGVAFAAKARERAGNMAAHTELAARTICGTGASEAAAVTDQALEGLPAGRPGEPAFEIWRQRIQDRFRKGV
jgi:hypothetical protein